MAQKILGIDIGTYSVKFLLLERSFNDFRVLHFVEQPLNLQTRLPHEELVALAIEQVFQNDPMPADIVSSSLSGHLISCRLIELPFTNTKKIDQVIEFELEGFIPFPVEDLHFDYHVLQKNEESSQVLCAYLQEENFVKYLDHLSQAHSDPKYFGSDMTDLANIAQIAMVPEDDYYLLCDIGHSKTNICIMQGKELRYARTIGLGGLHFTRAIQRSFNVNYEKAESLKLSRGKLYVRESETDQISRILNHVAKELVSQIKQTVLGFESITGPQNISSLYCVGGGSKLPGLTEFISFHLRVNVLDIDPLSLISHDLDEEHVDKVIMIQAVANAIRPVYSNRLPRINFRKGPFAFKQDIQVFTREMKTVGGLLGFILLLGVGYYFYAGHYYQEKMTAVDRKISQVAKASDLVQIKKRASVKRYLRAARSKLKEIKDQTSVVTGENSISVLEVMEEISKSLPAKNEVKFEISEFSYNDGFVRVDAHTDDPLSVSKISDALKASPLFAQVDTTDPQPKPNKRFDFKMTLNVEKSDKKSSEE